MAPVGKAESGADKNMNAMEAMELDESTTESHDRSDALAANKSKDASKDCLDVALREGGTELVDLQVLAESVRMVAKYWVVDYTRPENDTDGKRDFSVKRAMKEAFQSQLMYEAVDECMPTEKSALYKDMNTLVQGIVMTYIGKVIGRTKREIECEMIGGPSVEHMSPHKRTVYFGISKALFPDTESFELFSEAMALDHTDKERIANMMVDVADLTKEARSALASSKDMDVDADASKEKIQKVIQQVADAQ